MMKYVRSLFDVFLFTVFPLLGKGSYGNYASDFYEIAGWLVGIFFIWALYKIILKNKEEEEHDIEDHLIDEED